MAVWGSLGWGLDVSSVTSASFSTFLGQIDPWCDPQIQWDPAAGRWLYAILLCNTQSSSPEVFVFGWPKTSDPSILSPTGRRSLALNTPPFISDHPNLSHHSH